MPIRTRGARRTAAPTLAEEHALLPAGGVDEGQGAHVAERGCPPAPRAAAWCRFSSSVAFTPGVTGRSDPGAPPSAAASIPESSAIAGPPGCRPPRRLRHRVAANVSPSSGGSSTPVGQRTDVDPGGREQAPHLPDLVGIAGGEHDRAPGEQPRHRSARRGGHRLVLERPELLNALGRERQQFVQVRPGQRRALGGGLDLDETARPRS